MLCVKTKQIVMLRFDQDLALAGGQSFVP
jgi:hypothetical protein